MLPHPSRSWSFSSLVHRILEDVQSQLLVAVQGWQGEQALEHNPQRMVVALEVLEGTVDDRNSSSRCDLRGLGLILQGQDQPVSLN